MGRSHEKGIIAFDEVKAPKYDYEQINLLICPLHGIVVLPLPRKKALLIS
jgi:hypothetical protein